MYGLLTFGLLCIMIDSTHILLFTFNRLEPTICPLSSYYGYNTSASLPVLNDKKEKSLNHFYHNQKVGDCDGFIEVSDHLCSLVKENVHKVYKFTSLQGFKTFKTASFKFLRKG